MGKPYTVQRGDNLNTIARRLGLRSWQNLYNSPENAAFRARRPNPNLIFPGDIIVVPDGQLPPNLTPTTTATSPSEIDQLLLDRTKALGPLFDSVAVRLAGPPIDLRYFFTIAHGYITKKIAEHIDLFANPNALMRLNDSFATEYLNAINGKPHTDWQRAFRVCKGEQDAVRSGFVGLIFIGPIAFESCGACMANVHIKRDLRDALTKVTDVDPQDYGNVLVFVMRGNLYAETKIRGVSKGALMVMTSGPFAPKLNLDVKAWRNQVFQNCYRKMVPEPSSSFVTELNKREGIK